MHQLPVNAISARRHGHPKMAMLDQMHAGGLCTNCGRGTSADVGGPSYGKHCGCMRGHRPKAISASAQGEVLSPRGDGHGRPVLEGADPTTHKCGNTRCACRRRRVMHPINRAPDRCWARISMPSEFHRVRGCEGQAHAVWWWYGVCALRCRWKWW